MGKVGVRESLIFFSVRSSLIRVLRRRSLMRFCASIASSCSSDPYCRARLNKASATSSGSSLPLTNRWIGETGDNGRAVGALRTSHLDRRHHLSSHAHPFRRSPAAVLPVRLDPDPS